MKSVQIKKLKLKFENWVICYKKLKKRKISVRNPISDMFIWILCYIWKLSTNYITLLIFVVIVFSLIFHFSNKIWFGKRFSGSIIIVIININVILSYNLFKYITLRWDMICIYIFISKKTLRTHLDRAILEVTPCIQGWSTTSWIVNLY